MIVRSSSRPADALLALYIGVFLVYLFLPLGVMIAAAFNDFVYPSVTPWKGFTLDWFSRLAADDRTMTGLVHSLLLAAGVTLVSLPLGLAGAMVVSRGAGRAAGTAYAMLVSPILIPGVVLGLSTLVFWRGLGVPGGLFVAGAAQTSFIASYCMLLVLARLARQDTSLEEAALGLGASPWFLFRRVTLPYLAPSLAAAAVVGFLQSFENYNTTVFAVGGSYTLVTEIGSRLRFGLTPAVNALGVIFIAVTCVTSLAYALFARCGGGEA